MKLSILTATHHRPATLQAIALPSILAQTDPDFEWIIINDAQDPATSVLITELEAPCTLTYLEMPHPAQGFGLCHARNLGLEAASGDWIAYLDDDNAIAPEFVALTKRFLEASPDLQCSMVQQWRRRDVVRDGQVIKSGKPFISPIAPCSVEDLIAQRSLFDSNGFVHHRENAPRWNPDYRVFADYEFFLRRLWQWGRDGFRLHEAVLVNYVQRSDGVIGQSGYGEWARELAALVRIQQDYLAPEEAIALKQLVEEWMLMHQQGKSLSGFAYNE